MKQILESPEVFQAYARIECNLFLLKKAYDELFEKSLLEKMVDKATGYERKLINDTISILEDIIKDKEFIEAETTNEKDALRSIRNTI